MTVIEKLKLGERLGKVVEKRYEEVTLRGKEFTLWDVFITATDKLNEKDYKSEVHKERKLEKLSQTIFEYSALLNI